jgi:ADP-ribose pyrophosphatase
MNGSEGDGVPENPPAYTGFPVQSSQRIYDSHWCGLRRDIVILPSGAAQEYHVFEVPDAVAVVPVTRDGRIVLVGQYRYPHGKTHWEVPAGRISTGETPLAAAAREVREETGYRAARMDPLPGFYPTNGISAHFAHLFVGIDCEEVGELMLDDSEHLIVRAFDVRDVERMLDHGRFEDGFSAIALMYYLRTATARPTG